MNRLIKGLKRQTSCLSFSKLSLSFQKWSDSGFEWDIRPIVACVVNAPGGGGGRGGGLRRAESMSGHLMLFGRTLNNSVMVTCHGSPTIFKCKQIR